MQRFRSIADGITFEKLFTGYADRALTNTDAIEPSPLFRASGVLSLGIRRYAEGAGFQPGPCRASGTTSPAPPRLVPNEGAASSGLGQVEHQARA